MWKDKDKQRAYSRKLIKLKWDRWRANSACGRCGEPCGNYSLCKRHRIYQAKASRIYHKKHRAEILRKKATKERRKELRRARLRLVEAQKGTESIST